MPIYEYQCQACGEKVELMQRFSDPPLETCACGGKMRKLLSPPALVFKGSGFYITDYARKGKKSDSAPKTESKADSAS